MPIFCLTRPLQHPISRSILLVAIAWAVFFCAIPLAAQTLAHPGLADNGLNADPWWKHAVFYEIREAPAPGQSESGWKTLTAQLSSLRSLGVDALLLPMPSSTAVAAQDAGGADAGGEPPANFDELLREASRSGIRVLLTFTPTSVTTDPTPLARLWLSRGAAGFRVLPPAGATPQQMQGLLQLLRRATALAVGQRIVLTDLDLAAAPGPASAAAAAPRSRRARRSADAQTPALAPALQVDSRMAQLELPEATALRALLATSLPLPNVLLDLREPAPSAGSPDPYPALDRTLAVAALTLHSASLLDSAAVQLPPPATEETATKAPAATPPPGVTFTIPQPNQPHASAPPPSAIAAVSAEAQQLLAWDRQLISLHRNHAALRFGTPILLNFDQQNALVWVARPATNSALNTPVVVACNLSSMPVTLAIGPALKGLNLRGTYLRTLLRSDRSMGPQDIDAVVLPPFAVYLGELHR